MNFDFSIVEPYLVKLGWMVGLMVLDIAGGILKAVFVDKNFQWEQVPAFLPKYLLYIFGWGVSIFLGAMPSEESSAVTVGLDFAEPVVYTAVMVGVGASLLGHIAKFGLFPTQLAKFGVGDGTSRKDTK